MNKENMAVLTNIIGAVESGGQIYGKRNYAAYAGPYTNSAAEHTITLGWAQNYGAEAERLIRMILEKDPSAFRKLDTAGIEGMLQKDWVGIRWNPTAAQKRVLIALIDSASGHKAQDELFADLMEKYIKDCESTYTKETGAVMMYCEIRHLGGKGPADRIFKRCSGDYSLTSIMSALRRDQSDTSNNNQVGDAKFWSRHQKCREFIEKYAVEEVTPSTSGDEKSRDEKKEEKTMKTAEALINQARSWIGCKESNGTHKKIIDVYNSHKPLARGYRVKYTDSWCATFVSACAIKTGMTDLIPTECGCPEMVKLFQKLGEWDENDARVPKTGDIIFYDWQDKGSGDNHGTPDHVGIVEKVSGSTITVIEGNYKDSVRRRTLRVNGRYIRGYGVPKYETDVILRKGNTGAAVKAMQQLLIDCGYSCGSDGADGIFGQNTYNALLIFQSTHGLTQDGEYGPATKTALQKVYNSSHLTIEQAAKNVLAGKYGNGETRKKNIEKLGLDYAAVQARVNELLRK